MTTVETDRRRHDLTSPEDYTKAILNILEDFMAEKERLEDSQRAMLNLLDDFDTEKERLVATQRAAFNILEDFSEEKNQLEDSQRAMLNLLDDFDAEKERLMATQRAAFNILEDFSGEKNRLEDIQRATMNLLDDFDVERTKVKAAHHELENSFKSLRAAKEAAEAYNREVEAFSYSVSHDLRTPLRSIAGFSQVLLDDYSNNLDEKGRGFLGRVVAAATKMGLLIDDLLNLSRVTRTEMTRERVNLSEAARKISLSFAESRPERQVEFRLTDGLFADCDDRLFSIVLQNLLGNAWKFTHKTKHAVIEFGVLADNIEKVYFVRDNGAGFDMAYAGKLFNPFQRVHKAEDFPGTGIGLATVKRIVERHGGRIWIEGWIGKGATVYFTMG
jgi:signal transduction histidine kinase